MMDKRIFEKAMMAGLLCLFMLVPDAAFAADRNLSGIAADYLKNGRYLEALSFYRDVEMNLETRPELETASVYRNLGDLYLDYLDDADRAMGYYLKLVETFPKDPEAPGVYGRVAKAFVSLGQTDRAEDYLNRLKMSGTSKENADSFENALKSAGPDSGIPAVLPDRIRVLVLRSDGPVRVSSKSEIMLRDDNGTLLRRLSPGTEMVFSAAQGGMAGDHETVPLPIRLVPVKGGGITVNAREYRGELRVLAQEKQILVVNRIDLEIYLCGVVPKEVSPAWPQQALMAQSVAARTYALYHMLKRAESRYDVFSTTASQVYGGKSAEHPAARKAVSATHGEILTRNGRVVLALYHANSGGQTAGMDSVWNSEKPYLVSVRDEFSLDRPGCAWDKKLKREFISQQLKAVGLDVGRVLDVLPMERTRFGRISRLKVTGDGGSVFLSGNSFRLMVGPAVIKSTYFIVSREKDEFVFSGQGYGHGVGMSQWGVYTMAKKGYDYKNILKHFYPGVQIDRAWEGAKAGKELEKER